MSTTKEEDIARLQQRRSIRQPLTIQYPKTTPIFFVLILLAALLLIWAFFGRIPTEISGSGVAMSRAGTFVVSASAPGSVGVIYVKAGDYVKPGTPLALMNTPEVKSLLVQIETERLKICQLEAELALLVSTYETSLQLFQEGLVAKLVVDDFKTKIYEKKIAIEEAQATHSARLSELMTIASVSRNVVISVQEELAQHPDTLDLDVLAAKLSTLVAHSEGKILEVLVHEGDRVDRRAPLFWVEHPLETHLSEIFYSTVSADVIGRIKEGMRVLVEPLIVNPREYGSIIADVKKVYPYPVSKDELMHTLRNQQIVEFMIGNIPAKTLLIVEPRINEKNPSGFVWTSAKGPPFTIPSGTICTIKVVIDEQPPISYLIPLWRIKKPFQTVTGSMGLETIPE